MKSKQKKEQQEQIAYAKISFSFPMTEHEAKEILENPKGQIARNMRKYVNALVKEGAKRFFKEQETVKDCKDIDKKD